MSIREDIEQKYKQSLKERNVNLTNTIRLIKSAIKKAEEACQLEYADNPQVTIHSTPNIQEDISFTYIPSHLFYITFELLKNSMKAIM